MCGQAPSSPFFLTFINRQLHCLNGLKTLQEFGEHQHRHWTRTALICTRHCARSCEQHRGAFPEVASGAQGGGTAQSGGAEKAFPGEWGRGSVPGRLKKRESTTTSKLKTWSQPPRLLPKKGMDVHCFNSLLPYPRATRAGTEKIRGSLSQKLSPRGAGPIAGWSGGGQRLRSDAGDLGARRRGD